MEKSLRHRVDRLEKNQLAVEMMVAQFREKLIQISLAASAPAIEKMVDVKISQERAQLHQIIDEARDWCEQLIQHGHVTLRGN